MAGTSAGGGDAADRTPKNGARDGHAEGRAQGRAQGRGRARAGHGPGTGPGWRTGAAASSRFPVRAAARGFLLGPACARLAGVRVALELPRRSQALGRACGPKIHGRRGSAGCGSSTAASPHAASAKHDGARSAHRRCPARLRWTWRAAARSRSIDPCTYPPAFDPSADEQTAARRLCRPGANLTLLGISLGASMYGQRLAINPRRNDAPICDRSLPFDDRGDAGANDQAVQAQL
jgi:hypothetical protein